MNIIAERIKKRREELGISAEQLAEKIGKAKTTIYRYENGFIEKLPSSVLSDIAKALNVSPTYLMGIDDDLYITNHQRSIINVGSEETSNNELINNSSIHPVILKRFPMLGEIACGKPIYANKEFETFIDASEEIKADFCLTCKGDSMIGARINNGDVVFIKEQPIVDNGQIAAVIIDNDVTLKRWYYYPKKKKLVLQAENPNYEPLVYINEELDSIRCLGKVVYFMSIL